MTAIKSFFKDFFNNQIWKWPVVGALFLAILANGFLWYVYQTKIKNYSTPFIFATGLIILNLFLANYLWHREKVASLFLIFTTLAIQLLMIAFVRYLIGVF